MAKLGTKEHFDECTAALATARAAIEATGIDLDLIENFHDAAHAEALASMMYAAGRDVQLADIAKRQRATAHPRSNPLGNDRTGNRT